MNYEVRIMKEESGQRSAMSDQALADDRRSADFGFRIGQSAPGARATGHDRRTTNHGLRTTRKLIGRTKPFAPNIVVALGLWVIMDRR